MGFLRDSIVMDSGPIELRMEICEGEHRNHDGKGPLMTRLDFYETYPGCYGKGRPCTGRREWFSTVAEARARQRATIPAMIARYLQLIAEHGDDPEGDRQPTNFEINFKMKPRLIQRRVLTKPARKTVAKARVPINAHEFGKIGCHKCGANEQFTYEEDYVGRKSTAICDNCLATMWSRKWASPVAG